MTGLSVVESTSQAKWLQKQKLTDAAHEFEAQMMKELLKPMTRFGENEEEGSGNTLAELSGEALGRSLSRAGEFGIADRIVASLSRIGTSSDLDPFKEMKLEQPNSNSR